MPFSLSQCPFSVLYYFTSLYYCISKLYELYEHLWHRFEMEVFIFINGEAGEIDLSNEIMKSNRLTPPPVDITSIKNALFYFPTIVGSHNPSAFGASVLAGTCSFLQENQSTLLAGAPPRVYPSLELSLLAGTSSMSGSDTTL